MLLRKALIQNALANDIHQNGHAKNTIQHKPLTFEDESITPLAHHTPLDTRYRLFKATFQRGHDFVYGMSRPRMTYLENALGQEAMVLGGVPTVDMQNKFIVPTHKGDAITPIAGVSPDIKKYHDFLSTHPKEKYRELAKYRDRIAQDDPTAYDERKKFITRSCKAKIEETALNGHMIHFILDNDGMHAWDMNAVIKKEGVAGHLISAKELRYIYKNKDMRVSGEKTLSQHVIFWKNGQKVNAPWIDQPEKWQQFRRGFRQRS